MHRGHIKLYRRIRDHWIFEDAEDLKAWLVILLEVNHSAKKVKIGRRVLDCNRGEALYSYDTWATKFGKGWNKSRVRRYLSLLQNEKMIELKNDTQTTRLTVVNYNAFHDNGNEIETSLTRDRNEIETSLTPTKECKELKNEKKEPKTMGRFSPPSLDEVIAYCEERNRGVDAERWYNFYTSKGWMVGKNKMKDWRAAVRTWEQKDAFDDWGSVKSAEQMVKEGLIG